MAEASKVIESRKTSFIEATNQPGNGFLRFPAYRFRGVCQTFSCFKSEQGNSSLMAVQTFAGSVADARQFAPFNIRRGRRE